MKEMRRRCSARLLVLDSAGRVLLFRCEHTEGALAGQDYWFTPGGEVDPGETFEQAAQRELWEETGLKATVSGPCVAQREFTMQLPDGEHVRADERYFVVRTEHTVLSRAGWTPLEVAVMTGHKWWSTEELARATATIWPEELAALLHSVATAASVSPAAQPVN